MLCLNVVLKMAGRVVVEVGGGALGALREGVAAGDEAGGLGDGDGF